MGLIKCPRCDLNYIKDTEKYCSVCLREMKGTHSDEDEIELCSVCNAAPVVPGKDMCLNCLKEMNGTLNDDDDDIDNTPTSSVRDGDDMDLDSVDPMNEEMLPDDDIKDDDMKKLDEELSLEQVIEDEDEEEEEDEDEIPHKAAVRR